MRFLFALMVFCLFPLAHGEDNSAYISGKVFDAENNNALVGANILYGKQQGTITDRTGKFFIELSPGRWELSFQFIGYTTEYRFLTLTAGDTAILNVGLSPSLNEIDQIVISANRVEQKLSDLTVSMTLIKPGFFSNNHISDPQELINKTPGIEVLDGQASIRGGSGFSYGAGSRVMALIDGLPVISADAGNIRWQFLPLENLSQVEIIKGASSVMFGSSALNGIINFRTADAGSEPRSRFYIESGIFGIPGKEEWKWWDSPRIYTNASFSHMRKIGNTDLSIGTSMLIDNGYRRLNDEKMGRFNIRTKHRSKKVEGLIYGINLNSGITGKTDFILWEDAVTGALKQSESTANLLNGTFLTLDPYISLKKDGKANHDVRMRLQSTSNKFPDAAQNNSDALSLYTEYQYQKRVSRIMMLNLGLSENYSRVLSPFYGNHQAVNVAGYSQVDIETLKRVKLVAGIRVEQNIEDGNPDRFVPIFRTGVNYKLWDYSFLRASFGQGYRYPSIAEKFATTSIGSVKIFPNNELQPESGWNSEIGIKQGLILGNLNGMVDLAVFYSQNKEMIEYVFGIYPDPLSGMMDFGFRAANIEHSRVYGAELEFSLNQSAGIFNNSLSGGYILLHPVEYINSDKFLKYRRKHAMSLGWNSRIRKFDIGITAYAKSKILAIDNVFLGELTRELILPGFYDYWNANNKGYILADFTLGFRISEKIKLSMAVKNLLNKEYMGRPGDIMPHRNFSLRLTGNY